MLRTPAQHRQNAARAADAPTARPDAATDAAASPTGNPIAATHSSNNSSERRGQDAASGNNPQDDAADTVAAKAAPATVATPRAEAVAAASLANASAALPTRDADGSQDASLVTPVSPAPLTAATPVTLAVPTAAAHLAAAYAATVPLSGLGAEIATRAKDGKNRFEIRLDPPELGRIDVRLDVDRDGHVTSRLVVERSETLDLLRRDAPSLERALQSAGLKTDGGVEFQLRDQAFGRDRSGQDAPAVPTISPVPDDDLAPVAAAQRSYWRLRGLGSGVDISV